MIEAREQQTGMTVGELARHGGVRTSTVRYWDEQGLLKSRRTPGNQRRFDEVSLAQMQFIQWSQDVGASLDEIRGVLQLLPDGSAPDHSVQARASQCWRRRLDDESIELQGRYRRLSQRLTFSIQRQTSAY